MISVCDHVVTLTDLVLVFGGIMHSNTLYDYEARYILTSVIQCLYIKKISSVQNNFKTLSYKCHFQNVTLTADMASGHSSHVFSFTSCMASIHHLIG